MLYDYVRCVYAVMSVTPCPVSLVTMPHAPSGIIKTGFPRHGSLQFRSWGQGTCMHVHTSALSVNTRRQHHSEFMASRELMVVSLLPRLASKTDLMTSSSMLGNMSLTCLRSSSVICGCGCWGMTPCWGG